VWTRCLRPTKGFDRLHGDEGRSALDDASLAARQTALTRARVRLRLAEVPGVGRPSPPGPEGGR